jgi:tryptophan-rich sensory protein
MKLLIFSAFFLLNFGALALGGWLMGGSPATNDWYNSLQQAPWTPPGWVFGMAWTSIMICLSFYMKNEFSGLTSRLFATYCLQWVLNVGWNPLFFRWQLPWFSLLTIVTLTFVVVWMLLKSKKISSKLLITPYALWLLIATSLNAYIVFAN